MARGRHEVIPVGDGFIYDPNDDEMIDDPNANIVYRYGERVYLGDRALAPYGDEFDRVVPPADATPTAEADTGHMGTET